jgi:hypothetical protein
VRITIMMITTVMRAMTTIIIMMIMVTIRGNNANGIFVICFIIVCVKYYFQMRRFRLNAQSIT